MIAPAFAALNAATIWVDPQQIADGFITAPERPGHGLRFKEEVRKDFVVK